MLLLLININILIIPIIPHESVGSTASINSKVESWKFDTYINNCQDTGVIGKLFNRLSPVVTHSSSERVGNCNGRRAHIDWFTTHQSRIPLRDPGTLHSAPSPYAYYM